MSALAHVGGSLSLFAFGYFLVREASIRRATGFRRSITTEVVATVGSLFFWGGLVAAVFFGVTA